MPKCPRWINAVSEYVNPISPCPSQNILMFSTKVTSHQTGNEWRIVKHIQVIAGPWHSKKSVSYPGVLSCHRLQNISNMFVFVSMLTVECGRAHIPLKMNAINAAKHSRKTSFCIFGAVVFYILLCKCPQILLPLQLHNTQRKFLQVLGYCYF